MAIEITTLPLETVIDPLQDYLIFRDASEAALNKLLLRYVRQVEILIAIPDETTSISTGTAKFTFRMPFAMTLTGVRASVNTAPTGATVVFDINEEGTSILSTKLSIDVAEKTSVTAASQAVISDIHLADDAEMTVDYDQVGSIIPGKGVRLWLIGFRS